MDPIRLGGRRKCTSNVTCEPARPQPWPAGRLLQRLTAPFPGAPRLCPYRRGRRDGCGSRFGRRPAGLRWRPTGEYICIALRKGRRKGNIDDDRTECGA